MTGITNTHQLECDIQQKLKDEKFDKMLVIQGEKIVESMEVGKKSVVWIFSDKDYYHNELESSWFEEFEKAARKIYEDGGFKISGCIVSW